MRKLLLLLASCAIGAPALAQNTPARDLVKQGVQLYDEGQYDQAIAKYQQALAAEPTNDVAQAELALTYNALGRNAEAKVTCEQLLKRTPDVGPTLYVTYGNSLDGLGEFKQAEQAYREGMKKYPDSYALYYNLGVAQAGRQQYPAAIASFQQAVVRNPRHASSHMSAGVLQLATGSRVPGVLALARFLVLEPTGPRATQRLPQLDQAMLQGVSQSDGHNINISVAPSALSKGKKADDFGPEDLMLSMSGALTLDEKSKNKTKLEKFIDQFSSLCEVMGELSAKSSGGFVRTYYVPYFVAMQKKGFVPAFAYLAHSSQTDAPEVQQWLAAHPNEVQVFQEWSKNYEWPKQ
ncbi:MAG: tetratricopeptide repeat protein [Janthinobacterium lividum]